MNGTRIAAGGVVVVGLVASAAAVRMGASVPAGVALADALAAVPSVGEGPALVVLSDAGCPACREAVFDLRCHVLPEELGVRLLVLPHDQGAGRAVSAAVGVGLFPVYVAVHQDGRPLGMLRGYRPPAFVRRWLEDRIAEGDLPAGGDGPAPGGGEAP